MSNVTVATFRTWKGNPTAPADAVVQAAIDAAEEAINDDCGRIFTVAGAGTARLYAAASDRTNVLRIHDCTGVSAITVSGSAVTASDYQLEPVNNLTAAGDYSPYTQVRILGGQAWDRLGDEAIISVTATWGWATLPDRYTQAVEILAADLLEQVELRNGIVGFTEYAGIRVKANPMVAGLLKKLRRAEAWGIA